MASHSKGKSARHIVECPDLTSWREASLNGPPLILRLVNEAVMLSPIRELKQAASMTLTILQDIKVVKENKDAYARLGDDASGLIVVIWNSYKKTEFPNEWLSMEMREILEDLTHTLEDICSFVQEHISRKRRIRAILSKGDAAKKIAEYREHLNYAMQKFELQSQININDVLIQIMRQNDQISSQILHRNEEEDVNHALEITARDARDQELAEKMYEEEIEKLRELSKLQQQKQIEIDRQVEDERLHSEELKRIEKETKDRKSELERLRVVASAMEEANRLKKAEEEEIAKLKRTLATEEDNRRNTVQAQSSKKTKSSREDEIDEEQGEWEGNFVIEEATSEEEEDEDEDEEWPARNSNAKRNRWRSPQRRSVALENSADDVQRRKCSSKTRTVRQKSSRTSVRVEEKEDESMDDEDHVPPPPRKGRKVKSRPQSLPRDSPLDMDDFMGQIKDFIPFGRSFYGSRSDSHLGSSVYTRSNPFVHTYETPVSPPTPRGPYGYLPGTIVNSGVGNITSSTIANVGNDNSIKRVYRR